MPPPLPTRSDKKSKMRFILRTTAIAMVLIAALDLSACGGGSSGSDATDTTDTTDTNVTGTDTTGIDTTSPDVTSPDAPGTITDPGSSVVTAPVATDIPDYLPNSVGNRWLYQVTKQSPFTGNYSFQQMVSISGTKVVAGVETQVLQTRKPTTNELLDERYILKTSGALTEFFEPGNTLFGQPDFEITQLQLPLQSGTSFLAHEWSNVDTGVDFDHDGKNESMTVQLTVTVVGIENVSVPAGVYSNALKVSTLMHEKITYTSNATTIENRFVTDQWLVPGLGAVKYLRTWTYPQGVETYTDELTAYTVEGARSETVVPVVAQSQPVPTGYINHDAWPTITLAFSEPVDLGRANSLIFTLTDSSGHVVTGKPVLTSQQLQFLPSEPLNPGIYHATVTGVFDILGNELAPYTLEFTVHANFFGDSLDYQPMAVGNRWIYKVTEWPNTEKAVTSTQMQTFTDTRTIAGIPALVFETRDPVTNTVLGEAYATKTGAAINQVYETGSTPFGQLANSLVLYRLPFQAGSSYQTAEWLGLDVGRDYDGDGVNETLNARITVKVYGSNPITVPVRSYADAIEVITLRQYSLVYSSTGGTIDFSSEITDWMVSGVGTVKRSQVDRAPNQSKTTIFELTDYVVGDTRSDHYGPYAGLSQPSPSTLTQFLSAIWIALSEAIDLDRFNASDFSVVDSNGNPVNGGLNVSSTRLVFTPEQPLGDGIYTVSLSNIFDLSGNAGIGWQWPITVDTIPPAVISTSPADGATDVLTYTDVIVDFSELMGGASNYGSLTGTVPQDYLPYLTDSRLVLEPRTLLEHDTHYTVTLNGAISDRAGNKLPGNYVFSFTTLPAIFQPTTVFSTLAMGQATAIGDVDGDGRNDVVMVTSYSHYFSPIDKITLFIYLQNADGTLAASGKYPTGSRCYPSSVAIGDVTGDGQADIVMGDMGCGMKIFQRTTDGDWPVPPSLTSQDTDLIRLGDMNNDGRLDIVGVSGSTNTVTVWYQQPAGGLGAPTPYSVIYSGREDLALGDTNGDGLTDIVVTGNQGAVTSNIAVMTQSSSGGFNTPAYFGTGTFLATPIGCAVGDVNNDGRQDVVVTLSSNDSTTRIGLLYQQADGSLGPLTLSGAAASPPAVEIADINNDGLNDIVTAGGVVGVFRQTLNGTLMVEDVYPASTAAEYPHKLAVGDLNSDGFIDAAVAGDEKLQILYSLGH